MRKHQITPDVGQRDSAYFSVIDDEWPTVRAALEARLVVDGPKPAYRALFGPSTSSRSLSSGWTTRSVAARTSSPASRVAATACSATWATPSLGLPPTMSRKASLKRSVRRPGWKRASAFACFFGRRSP